MTKFNAEPPKIIKLPPPTSDFFLATFMHWRVWGKIRSLAGLKLVLRLSILHHHLASRWLHWLNTVSGKILGGGRAGVWSVVTLPHML